jgi:DNA polymerase-3 subunit epsilon
MILFFDTETTGLMPGRIVQLSYVMQDKSEVRAKNFFFYVDYIEPSAIAVHGFTPEKLLTLSNGHTFSMDLEEIYDDFLAADLVVSHNFSFDLKFMIAEFLYHERQFRYRESLCTMKFFTDILRLPRSSNRGYK